MILDHATEIRIVFFIGIFLLMVFFQYLMPRRKNTFSTSLREKIIRWSGNLGILFINNFVVRLLFPMAMTGFAVLVQQRGWGLFNNVELPFELTVLLAVILFDFAIYVQHILFHVVPLLWSFHRMHHSDTDFDVTTGTRFHPVEIIVSVSIKLGVIILIGPPALAVLIFEVLLNATAMFNHSNIYLPVNIDRVLRWLVVTPDMHRVHHSVEPKETNSNYGFNIPWWDRIFGTYIAQPDKGHQDMEIGLAIFRDPKYLQLHWLFAQPFINGNKHADN